MGVRELGAKVKELRAAENRVIVLEKELRDMQLEELSPYRRLKMRLFVALQEANHALIDLEELGYRAHINVTESTGRKLGYILVQIDSNIDGDAAYEPDD